MWASANITSDNRHDGILGNLATLTVFGEDWSDINVGNGVGVDNQEVSSDYALGVDHAHSIAVGRRLRVHDIDSVKVCRLVWHPIRFLDPVADLLGFRRTVDDNIANVAHREPFEGVLDEWNVDKWEQRL